MQTLGSVFADECLGETKETKNESILCLVALKEKMIDCGARGPRAERDGHLFLSEEPSLE